MAGKAERTNAQKHMVRSSMRTIASAHVSRWNERWISARVGFVESVDGGPTSTTIKGPKGCVVVAVRNECSTFSTFLSNRWNLHES